MTDYNFGDVVLVLFPFTDQTTTKKRPAVVVSSSVYNQERPDIVLMAVTSQVRLSDLFGEVEVTEWKRAGLLKASVIKPIFTTIEKALVLKKLGRLGKKDRKVLRETLEKLVGD